MQGSIDQGFGWMSGERSRMEKIWPNLSARKQLPTCRALLRAHQGVRVYICIRVSVCVCVGVCACVSVCVCVCVRQRVGRGVLGSRVKALAVTAWSGCFSRPDMRISRSLVAQKCSTWTGCLGWPYMLGCWSGRKLQRERERGCVCVCA